MFKKTKLTFVLTSLLIVSLMLTLLCVFIYGSVERALIRRTTQLISRLSGELCAIDLESGGRIPSNYEFEGLVHDIAQDIDDRFQRHVWGIDPVKHTKIMLYNLNVLYADDDGRVKDRLGLTDRAALEKENLSLLDFGRDGIVKIDGVSYRYSECDCDGHHLIVLSSRENNKENLNTLFYVLLQVSIASILFMLLPCIIAANLMVIPLKRTWQAHNNFIADASHELKTPLSVIGTNIDAVLSNPDETVRSQKKWLLYIKDEIESSKALVYDLLTIADQNSGIPHKNRRLYSEFDASELLECVCLFFESSAFEADLKIKTDIEKGILLFADQAAIKQLFTIMLDNAIKYTPKGELIEISLSREGKNMRFICKNACEKIEKNDLANIFKRFFRTDSSRTRETGGSGLGLPIAEGIVKSHGGRIRARLIREDCIEFSFTLKLVRKKH